MIRTLTGFFIVLLAFQAPAGTITGRVLNDNNQPVAGIKVQLLHEGYDAEGMRGLTAVKMAVTDQRGEYRISGISPSRYYVATDASDSYRAAYFPGVSDAASATPVEVSSEREVTNIDLIVARAKRVTVSGFVVDLLHVRQPHIDTILLVAKTAAGFGPSRKVEPDQTGNFEFRNVPAGSYYVMGRRIDDAPNRAEAVVPVEVRDADIDNIELALREGFDLAGRIEASGSAASGVRVTARPAADPRGPLVQNTTATPDGKFHMVALPAGQYHFSIHGVPAGYYVQSAKFGAVDLLEGDVSIGTGIPPEIVIALSNDGGRIDGTVVRPDKAPANKALVVLIPLGHRSLRPDLYRTANADAGGKFMITGIAPGDYLICAWDQLEPYAYYDPNFVQRFNERGRRVHITAVQSVAFELTITQI